MRGGLGNSQRCALSSWNPAPVFQWAGVGETGAWSFLPHLEKETCKPLWSPLLSNSV